MPVFDCRNCLCRFTDHDELIYDHYHAESISYYAEYRYLVDKCTELFSNRDVYGLKDELTKSRKYRFIIEQVEKRGDRKSNILELGCATGFLTSYFILAGYRAHGVDTSETAVRRANHSFGNHFTTSIDSAMVSESGPFDVIYHVGMIGCVKDPLGLTERLLGMLKSGGQLFFNAPNLCSLSLRGQLWIDTAPPPDLVTLFPPAFWTKRFQSIADVDEEIENCAPDQNLVILTRKLSRRRWKKPVPGPLKDSQISSILLSTTGGPAWRYFERVVQKLGRVSRVAAIVPKQPSEFGLLVSMTRK